MRTAAAAALLLTLATATGSAQTPARTHVQPDFKWGPAPAIFPPGAQMAVLQGAPGATEPFTVRLHVSPADTPKAGGSR